MNEDAMKQIDDMLSKLPPAEREEIQAAARKMKDVKLNAVMSLFKHVEDGNLAKFIECLEENKELSVESKDDQGRVPLHLACFMGKLEMAKFLVNEKNVSVNVADNFKRTPLHCVAFGNHEKIAKLIVLKGADVNALDEKKCTPLHWACKKGHIEVGKLLIDRGSELNAQTEEGWTPLHLACEGGHSDMAMLLCSRGADINIVDEKKASPLRVAVNTGNAVLVQYFLERNAEGIDDIVNNTALIDLACIRGNMEVAELLVKHGAKVTEKMLKKAIKDSHIRLFRICVEHNVPNIPQTGLYLACKKGETDLVIRMVEHMGFTVDLTCFKLAHESREKKLKEWVRKKAAQKFDKKCIECGKEESEQLKLLRCGRCKIVKYCGSVCQKKGYPEHKIYCFGE